MPRLIEFDPELDVLAIINHSQKAEEWAEIMRKSTGVAAKLHAVRELAQVRHSLGSSRSMSIICVFRLTEMFY